MTKNQISKAISMKILQNNYGGIEVSPDKFKQSEAYYQKPWRDAIKNKLESR